MSKDVKELNIKNGTYTFAEKEPMKLESGKTLGPITLFYETYGTLNKKRDNVILICHALTGNAHVAGKLPGEKVTSAWWNPLIGKGKVFDTDKYFIVCSNLLGGCSGSTGPKSIDPKTGNPYAMNFPIVTITDMVRAQHCLMIDHFKIKKIKAVVGGSIGGMQVLQWAVMYPDLIETIIPIATPAKLSPQAIAFNKVGRHAIMIDPLWNDGNYYNSKYRIQGLGLARMVAHITYLSEEGMQQKFGREHTKRDNIYTFDEKFQIESYLDHQGSKFIDRFDANSYIYLSKAMDLFNLARGYNSIDDAISRIKAKTLYIFFSSDWLFPEHQSMELVDAFQRNNKFIVSYKVESHAGHDAFLVDYDKLIPIIDSFMSI